MRHLIPAAEYLRMSTDDQPNSLSCQRETIRRYAAKHGFEVLSTYADPGRSGVQIIHRPGLRKLLQEVVGGHIPFKVILVYDVSRWGRFQDTDESAYYEFICRSAGVPVLYCAEQFENDGTMSSAMMKALKRTMAAEFSRELSVKVRAAQRRVAVAGFRVGGRPGFGLRRMAIAQDGRRKLLQPNERKGMATDGVILVPGPKHEVDCIRTIFRLAGDRRNTPSRIAKKLNGSNVTFSAGGKWREATVLRILENQKYMGTHVWGKIETQFNAYRTTRPRDQWIVKPGAYPAIVSPDEFARAQRNIQKRKTWPTNPDEVFLKAIRRVLSCEGRLTERLLRKHRVFGYGRYALRHGSVTHAYERIGYQASKRTFDIINTSKKFRRLRSELLDQLRSLFPAQIRFVRMPGQSIRQVVEVGNEILVALHVCRPSTPTRFGEARWVLITQPKERGLPALLCAPDPMLQRIERYYLVPPLPELRNHSMMIGETHPWLTSGIRLRSLSQFCASVKEMNKRSQSLIEDHVISIGDVLFTSQTSTISIAGHEIQLSGIQGAIFKFLARNSGNVVSRERLAEEGLAVVPRRAKRTMDPCGAFVKLNISELRRKLGKFRDRIVTVWQQGYLYDPRSSASNARDGLKVPAMLSIGNAGKCERRRESIVGLGSDSLPALRQTRVNQA